MIIKEIICDRCCAKIEEEHPVRINIEQFSTEASTSYGVKCKGYRSARKLHFCKSCDDAFIRFIQGGEG